MAERVDIFKGVDIGRWEPYKRKIRQLRLPEEAQYKIRDAYKLTQEAHRTQTRLSGEKYFRHLWRTGYSVLYVATKVDTSLDKDLIRDWTISGLGHDWIEDTAAFGRPLPEQPYIEWEDEVEKNIADRFSPRSARSIRALTEPMVNGIDILDADMAKQMQTERLSLGPSEEVLPKMPDRSDNLWTFHPTAEKPTPTGKIKDTEEKLIPIFERVVKDYPKAGNFFMRQIEEAILHLLKRYLK